MKNWIRNFGIGTSALAFSGIAYGRINDPQFFEKARRPLVFWKNMFPIYLDYRYTDWKLKGAPQSERDEEFHKLHVEYAPKVLEVLLNLRGVYVKLGQVCVTREDLMPDIYRNAFRILLDKVPPLPYEQVKEIVQQNLSVSFDEYFSEFHQEPIGAASIGQVHKAKLKSNGQWVAVKVKYPDAFHLMDTDMNTLKNFAELAQPENAIVLDEMKRQFLTEFDYRREGKALELVSKNLAQDFPEIVVPKPLFYTSDILIMEFLKGEKLIDVAMSDLEYTASQIGIPLKELTDYSKKNKGKPYPVNMWTTTKIIAENTWDNCIQWIQWAVFPIYNYTFGFITQPLERSKPKIRIPNQAVVYNRILAAHAHQAFIDGLFNGDPHPGNILLLDSGKIGLIDYGQVKTLSLKDRHNLAQLIITMSEALDNPEARPKLIQKLRENGFHTAKEDDSVAWDTACLAFHRSDPEALGGLNFQQKLEELDKRDRTTTLPEQFVMFVRY